MANFDADICRIAGTFTRIVESQAQVATTQLVGGDLARQNLLEEILEDSKPSRVAGTERLHYLLATPWRYPPLRFGSRFGKPTEPSLFYASLEFETALAEAAYYRWVFFSDMQDPPPKGLSSQHTTFTSTYETNRGLQLQHPPFNANEAALTHPSDYTNSQALGTAMRNAEIEAFEFRSARGPNPGINVALIHPQAHASTTIDDKREWLCRTETHSVTFSTRDAQRRLITFEWDDFRDDDGVLPKPA